MPEPRFSFTPNGAKHLVVGWKDIFYGKRHHFMIENSDQLPVTLPDQKNYEVSYGLAFKLAGEKLSAFKDLEEQCRRSDSTCRTSGSATTIFVEYLNSTYQVTLPDITITAQHCAARVELRDQILILHYLALAKGTPLSHKLVAYQELKEGAVYYPTFIKRSIKPLIDFFGPSPEKLVDVSSSLGGYRADYGDAAVTIPAFKRIPITLVMWKGDDEFPPDANILFDNTIQDYLPAEDINVLCQTVSWQLVKRLQTGMKKEGER
jgi:hypothetical protein